MALNTKILLLDDDPEILKVYTDTLAPTDGESVARLQAFAGDDDDRQSLKPGFELYVASQGEKGVAMVRQAVADDKPFAAALIDVRMPPGMDGIEAARQIRKLDDDIYIFIVTAYSDHSIEEMQEAIAHNIVLVQKPVIKDELYQMVRNACNSWTRDHMVRESMEICEEWEERRMEFTLQLNRVFSEIQNKVIAIPVVILLIGGQMETGAGLNIKNVSILISAVLFAILTWLLMDNQREALDAIKKEIEVVGDRSCSKVPGIKSKLEDT